MINLEAETEMTTGVKTFVLDEGEHEWQGFVHDRNCCSEVVQKFFPGVV